MKLSYYNTGIVFMTAIFLLASALYYATQAGATTYNNISVDGTQTDWQSDEVMGTDASSKFNVTWNSTYLFIGVSDQDWSDTDGGEDGELHIYFNTTTGGATSPIDWGSSGVGADTLPFGAEYALIVDDGNDYQLQKWTGSWVLLRDENNWTDIGASYVGWSGNNKTEISMNRSILGDPTSIGLMAFATQENSAITWATWPVENPTGGAPLTFTYYYYIPSFGPGISPNSSFVLNGSTPTWMGANAENNATNTVWADIYPGSSADDNAGTTSDGSLTTMRFYYTLDGSTPTNASAYIDGTFDGQNGTNGNNDKYYAIIPAQNGQTVKWTAEGTDAYGRHADVPMRTYVSAVPSAIVISNGQNPNTNTVWADIYPGSSADDDAGTVSDGSLTAMRFYYTLDGTTPTNASAYIDGTFDSQNGTNGNNDKYYAIVPAQNGQTVKWVAEGTGFWGDNNTSAVHSFVSSVPTVWVGAMGANAETNTVWAEVYPGSSADDNAGTQSDGSLTAMRFYYTLDGSTPTHASAYIDGTFDDQNGTNGNNDKYYAIIPAQKGQTVKWFANGTASSGLSGNTTISTFVSQYTVPVAWVGSSGSDGLAKTIWAEVSPGSSYDNNPSTVSDGSLTSMRFYYTTDNSTPTLSGSHIDGTFDGQSGINGNNDKYYAILDVPNGTHVNWFALGYASNGANNTTAPSSFVAGAISTWVGNAGSDAKNMTVWAEVYPADASNGSDTEMTFYYTLDGTEPTTHSNYVNGTFDSHIGNNDKYYAIIPAQGGQTVKWFARGKGSGGLYASTDIYQFKAGVEIPPTWLGNEGSDPITNTVWAEVYPALAGDGSDTDMAFYYTLNGSTPTMTSIHINGIFDGHIGNNDKYYAIIPAQRGQTVKWFAWGHGSGGDANLTSTATFVSNVPGPQDAVVSGAGYDPYTGRVWAGVYPSGGAGGTDTSMTFYYTLNGATPTNHSTSIPGVFTEKNGSYDVYSASIPASVGTVVSWFAQGTAANGAINTSTVLSFTVLPVPISLIGNLSSDAMNDTVQASIYPAAAGDGSDTTVKFYYTLDGSIPTNQSQYVTGIFTSHQGNSDLYSAVLPASYNQTVRWFAVGRGSNGAWSMSDVQSYVSTNGAPVNPDKDNDGMPDGWEGQHGLDNTTDDSMNDPDGDGLSNLQEYGNGTNPLLNDTDGDGMLDGWEVNNGLNPTVSDAVGDTDSDGLTNLEEYLNGTSPMKADTDGDGMPDGWEVNNGLDPLNASDALTDLDGDGLSNLQEYENGTNPFLNDSDGDGMPDGWEVQHGLDPTVNDGLMDKDGDGLSNLKEYALGTDPNNPDTDGDGMPDKYEVDSGLEPTVPDASNDTDDDGLTNLKEYLNGTSPVKADSDGDGIPDGWEVQHGLNPLYRADAQFDADSDGATNLEEYQAGTDPQNSSSHPQEKTSGSGTSAGSNFMSIIIFVGLAAVAAILLLLLKRKAGEEEAKFEEGGDDDKGEEEPVEESEEEGGDAPVEDDALDGKEEENEEDDQGEEDEEDLFDMDDQGEEDEEDAIDESVDDEDAEAKGGSGLPTESIELKELDESEGEDDEGPAELDNDVVEIFK